MVEEIEWRSSAISFSLHFYSCKETFGISKIYISVILYLFYWFFFKLKNSVIV